MRKLKSALASALDLESAIRKPVTSIGRLRGSSTRLPQHVLDRFGVYDQGMSWPERIAIEPEVLAGKPVVRGTRLAVEFILELLAAGQSGAAILACLAYAVPVIRPTTG